MKVCVCLEVSFFSKDAFHIQSPFPAPMGGSEKQLIELALLLSTSSDFETWLVWPSNQAFANCLVSHGFACEPSDVIDAQCDLLISSQSSLKVFGFIRASKSVVWIHHPFAQFYGDPDKMFAVCCSKYSLRTLRTNLPSVYIYNKVFPPELDCSDGYSENKILSPRDQLSEPVSDFAFIGALRSSKGLHMLLDDWPKLIKPSGLMRLHIIGSSDLYHRTGVEDQGRISESSYTSSCVKVAEHLMEIDSRVSIIFHGALVQERFALLRKCSLVIVNPTGVSEAFSTSIIECFVNRIPVVSGKHYGNRELLHQLPHAHYRGFAGILNHSLLGAYSRDAEHLLDLNYARALGFSTSEHGFDAWTELVDTVLFSSPEIRSPASLVLQKPQYFWLKNPARMIEKKKIKFESYLSKKTLF